MDKLSNWTRENRALAIVVAIGIIFLIMLAIFYGLDLAWIPGLLGGMLAVS